MKKTKLLFLFIFLASIGYTQKPVVNIYAGIDKKALLLPDSLTATTAGIAKYISANFKTDKEKTRAAFIWVASNIEYDAANMFAINFYEKEEDKIKKPLLTRKGICENYAALFSDICNKVGVQSYVIDGYTKQNGFADYIPHAWCAALIDSSWLLFDPTWGSGYISGGKFFRKINNDYYNASPASFIQSHMPFDYLWQFLHYPVTNGEFYEGKTAQDKTKPFYSYTDSIQAYEKGDTMEQLQSEAVRIERSGIKNSLIYDRLQHIKIEIENNKQTKTVNQYNAAVHDYNIGVNDFNDFINYRNKQFTPTKTDAEIQDMIDLPDNQLRSAKTKLGDLKNADANIAAMATELVKSIDDAMLHVKEQQDWLKVYFAKGKSGRKSMFYDKRVTWFGIPLTK